MSIYISEVNNLDNYNANTLWQDEIDKDMENYQVAFKLIGHEDKLLVGYK